MLRDGEQSVIKQVTTRINGLKKISRNADFRTRLTVATGIVQSKLQYLMPLWIGAPEYLINALQVQQLNAARTVCGYHSYFWSTTKLLNKCGWLSVRQQMVMSTVIMAQNIMTTGVPRNIHAAIATEHPYRTRQATSGGIRVASHQMNNITSLSERTFKFQARKFYNQLPGEMRQLGKVKFRKEVRNWVKHNVPIR